MNESKQTLIHHVVDDDVNGAAKAIASQPVTIVVGNPGMGIVFRALTALGHGAEEINGMDLQKSGSSVKEAMQVVLGKAKEDGVSVALTQWSGFAAGDMIAIAEAVDAFAQNGAKVALITSQPAKAAKMSNAFVAARSIAGQAMGGYAIDGLKIVIAGPGEGAVSRLMSEGYSVEIDAPAATGRDGLEGFEKAFAAANANGASIVISGAGFLAPAMQEAIATQAYAYTQESGAQVAMVSHSTADATRLANLSKVLTGTPDAPGISDGLSARRAKASDAAAPEAPKKPSAM